MEPDASFRLLRQATEQCDDCDKPPMTGCIGTWFPSWFFKTEHEPDHPCSDADGNLMVARYAKRCPQFADKKVDPTKGRKRFGFVVIGKKK